MTVVNPKSISGINSITTGSGSDNLLTIHTSDASSTERVRINSSGDVIVGSGITVSPDGDIFATGVTTSTTFVGALTGNVTGNATGLSGTPNISAGTIAGSTGTFTGDVDIADKIIHTGDTNTAIRFPSADTVTVETGGSERLRIASGGKIGLNQSGPYAELDITSSVEDTTTGALSAHGIRLGAVGATDEQVIPITAGFKSQQDRARAGIGFISKPQSSVEGYAGAIGFYTRASADASVLKTTDEKMRLDGNGLGIGTAASGGRLHVHDEGANVYTKVTNNSGTRAFLGCESGEAVIYAQDDSGGNAELAFHTGSTEQFKMTTSGIAFPSGKGIDFSATSDAGGMASELLDDYEEGTFTPRLGPNVSMSTIHENGVGRYTKIGNMVTCTMHWIAKDGTAFPTNETIRIDTLPYTIKHVGNASSAHYVAMSQMMYNIQFGQQDKHYFYSSNNQTYLTGLKSRDGTSWQDWSTSDWNQSNIYLMTAITYMTTS